MIICILHWHWNICTHTTTNPFIQLSLPFQSGVGIGGILSVIGAGIVSDRLSVPAYPNDEEDAEAPAPKTLSKILMTDKQEDILERCIENLEAAKFPDTKVKLGLLEWGKNVQGGIKDQCQFVMGCDCAEDFVPLARTVAFALKCSPFDGQVQGGDGDMNMTRASFLHIEPRHRDCIDDLKRELKKGYRMNTMMMKEIELERVHLEPNFADSLEDAQAQLKEDMEAEVGGFVKYQNIDTSGYAALVGYHNKDYCGFNGQDFFPAELERQRQAEKEEEEAGNSAEGGAELNLPVIDEMGTVVVAGGGGGAEAKAENGIHTKTEPDVVAVANTKQIAEETAKIAEEAEEKAKAEEWYMHAVEAQAQATATAKAQEEARIAAWAKADAEANIAAKALQEETRKKEKGKPSS